MCYIARALVSEPDIVVLDEPESNLDFNNQARIIKLLQQLSREKNVTIILNIAFYKSCKQYCGQMFVDEEKGVFFGNKEVVLREERLGEYFNVPVKRCYFEHRGVQEESFVIAL